MKIVCLQKNLQKGLNITEKIVGKNTTLPILSNILLETQKGLLSISSTNLEIGINCCIPAKIEKNGSITIPAKLFSGFINNLPNDKVFLEVKNNNLNIKLLNYSAVISGELAKNFPIIPKITGEELFNINTTIFKNGLNQVIHAASFTENRPEINSIFINIVKDKIIMAATDSFRLAEKTINFNKKSENNTSFIIPIRSAQELLRILGEKDGEIKVIISKNQILFSIKDSDIDEPGVDLVSRLIDGNFPDYKQLIPKDFKTKLIINKNELLNSVKISSVFSGKINDVKFSIFGAKNEIDVAAKDFSAGENISKIKGEVTGDDLDITFNYKYIIDGLNGLVGENVFWGFNGPTQPSLLRVLDNRDYFYIVMPIRNQ
ncbi:MAG: DNA polymerase III subunit beta [Patescibacteria group bacterium]